MKFLVLLLVLVGVVAVWVLGRRRPPSPPAKSAPDADPTRQAGTPQAMLACAHCGVHLPSAEALRDSDGRGYCSDAHRLAGPRSAG